MSHVYLDPTGEQDAVARPRAPRLPTLVGRTVGLLNINKPRGDVFLARLAERLTERGIRVAHFSKPTFTKPAPIDLRQEIGTQCDAVIEALAD